MTYKDSLIEAMTELGKDPKTLFIGYNTRFGGRANGTLIHVSPNQCIETPVAENLMAGLAVGLSLDGFRPVVYFERFDFILNALDAIVNHADKMDMMSSGQFKPKVLFRVVVGSARSPLFTGPTHTQNFHAAMCNLVSFPILEIKTYPKNQYERAKEILENSSVLIIEHRELYGREVPII